MNRLEQLTIMLKENPEDVFLNYAIAMEHMSSGNNSDAIQKLQFVMALDRNYLPLYYQLAKLYELVGETDKAIETYENGMVIAGENDDRKTYGELRSALEELTF